MQLVNILLRRGNQLHAQFSQIRPCDGSLVKILYWGRSMGRQLMLWGMQVPYGVVRTADVFSNLVPPALLLDCTLRVVHDCALERVLSGLLSAANGLGSTGMTQSVPSCAFMHCHVSPRLPGNSDNGYSQAACTALCIKRSINRCTACTANLQWTEGGSHGRGHLWLPQHYYEGHGV